MSEADFCYDEGQYLADKLQYEREHKYDPNIERIRNQREEIKRLNDLINRQKAEIERLAKLTELDDKHIKNLEKAFNDRTAELQDAKFDNKQLRRDVERLDKRRINDCRHWQEKYNSLRTEAVKEVIETMKPWYRFLCVDKGDWYEQLDAYL